MLSGTLIKHGSFFFVKENKNHIKKSYPVALSLNKNIPTDTLELFR